MRRPSRSLALLVPALLAAASAACGNNGAGSARLGTPTSMVPFQGVTRRSPALRDYIAVASSRGDEINFVDPFDDQPVLGPSVVFSLSIPTEPRPLHLAAASLGDRSTGGADLLVSASAGSLDLQAVETWTATNRVAPSAAVALAPLLGEGEILALLAMTPPGAVPGDARARVLAAATGGRLAIVDYTRDPQTGGVLPQKPILQNIGIDVVAMVLEPGGTRVFMATRDPIPVAGGPGVSGVAVIDAAADLTVPLTVTAIDARAPTVALAAALVNERTADPTAPDTFQPVPQLRIYAVLDQARCGNDQPIDCGVVAMDDHALVPDPAGELPYRAPLQVPTGVMAGVAMALPPAQGASRIQGDVNNPGVALMVEQPGNRNTAALAAATSSDGFVYAFDLSRFVPLNAISTLAGDLRLQVIAAETFVPADAGLANSPDFGRITQLGLWNDFPLPAPGVPSVTVDPGGMVASCQVTPGYTRTDQYLVTWQGVLPGLRERRGVVGRAPTGELYVAIQANAGTVAAPVWVAGTDLSDPALGVRAGDVVVVTPDDPSTCPPSSDPTHPFAEPAIDTTTPFLAPDPARFPLGAVQLAAGTCFDGALAAGQVATATVTVRAAALVLTSNLRGYLGRPVLNQPFLLQHQDESTATGEALAIARKVRRQFYPIEPACGSGPGCYGGYPWLANPLAPGPEIGFRVGLARPGLPSGSPLLDPGNPAALQGIGRDAHILLRTQSGMAIAGFRPVIAGVLPSAVIPFDRTGIPGHQNDAIRFFVMYGDDQLLDFSPSIVGGDLISIH